MNVRIIAAVFAAVPEPAAAACAALNMSGTALKNFCDIKLDLHRNTRRTGSGGYVLA